MRGCRTLEEAFIAYMKDDIARNTIAEMDDEKQTVPFMLKSERVIKHGRLFDIYRLAALARREPRIDPRPGQANNLIHYLAFLLIVFGFWHINKYRKHQIQYHGQRPEAIEPQLFGIFLQFTILQRTEAPTLPSEIDKGFQSNEFNMVVEIPPGFEKDIKRGKSPSVGLWIDGTMPFSGRDHQELCRGRASFLSC